MSFVTIPANPQAAQPATASGDPELLYGLGNAQLGARDFGAAIESYRQCVAARPHFPQAYNNLGSALIEVGRFEEAVAALEAALELMPGYVRPLINLGRALRELGRTDEAVKRLEAALALEPRYAPALINLGDALIARDELSRARQALTRAIELAPGAAMAHASLGICELLEERVPAALQHLHRARALDPGSRKVAMTLGYALFMAGDWPEAWRFLQLQWQMSAHAACASRLGLPHWDGVCGAPQATMDVPRGSLALVADQGFGDSIQFARYGQELRQHGFTTTLFVQRPLVTLMRSSGLFDRVVAMEEAAGTDAARPDETHPQVPRAWFALMSLPGPFATGPGSVPQAAGYLQADPQRVAAWSHRMGGEQRYRVGIMWQGNPRAETGFLVGRSPALETLRPIVELDSVAFYSLQKGFGAEQLTHSALRDRIVSFEDLDAGSDAFIDSAAVIANLDLVVTSDTALAHLAGALGRPVWICLQKYPDWRWAYAKSRTPWYSSARLFRQHRQGDWGSVFGDIRRELMGRTRHGHAAEEGLP